MAYQDGHAPQPEVVMLLHIRARPAACKFIIRSRIANQNDDAPCIQIDMLSTDSVTARSWTLQDGVNAFQLPVSLTIEPGPPFGPIDPSLFKIRTFEGDRGTERFGELPEFHLGTLVYSAATDEFPDAQLSLHTKLADHSFNRLWDWVGSGNRIEAVFIELFGDALRVERGYDRSAWCWDLDRGNKFLLCAQLSLSLSPAEAAI
jgi:hypothetical protein